MVRFMRSCLYLSSSSQGSCSYFSLGQARNWGGAGPTPSLIKGGHAPPLRNDEVHPVLQFSDS